MGLFNCGGRFYHVTNLSDLSDQLAVTMTNQNNILTEEEIKELIGSLNRNPNKAEIRAVIDYF